MAVTFRKPVADQSPVVPPATTTTIATASNAKPSWLLSGEERKAVMAQAEAQAALAREQQNSMWRWRWRLRMGEQGQLTWLDGALDGEGLLAGQSFWQHTKRINQRWENFVCVAQFGREPCPICDAGEKPAFATVFTIVDHRPYQIQNGPKAGQVIQNQRKLFVAKANDLALLQFQATALGGLAGHRFTVGRIGTNEKQTSSVGNQFVPMGQQTPLAELAAQYGEHGIAADYEKEIPILSAAQLIQLGAGRSAVGPGYPVGAAATAFDAKAMADAL